MFPEPQNQNEGTKSRTTVQKNQNDGTKIGTMDPKTKTTAQKSERWTPKAGTRAHLPKLPCYKPALLFPLDRWLSDNQSGNRTPDDTRLGPSFRSAMSRSLRPSLQVCWLSALWTGWRTASNPENSNHEDDENNDDNSDSYKQGVECWISRNHRNYGNDENHRNPGGKPLPPKKA